MRFPENGPPPPPASHRRVLDEAPSVVHCEQFHQVRVETKSWASGTLIDVFLRSCVLAFGVVCGLLAAYGLAVAAQQLARLALAKFL